MRNIFKLKSIIIAAVFLSLSAISAKSQQDPYKLIEKVKKAFDKINDYEADLKITSDIEFLKLPEMKAHIYFKKPNKMKVKSDDFAMVPKNAVNFSPISFFDSAYTAVFIRDEVWGEDSLSLIKVIPESQEMSIVSSIWIDKKKLFIRKIEAATSAGKIKADFNYNKNAMVPLPSFMNFSFTMEGLKNIPKFKSRTFPQLKGGKGNVKIYYNNYKVNKGIDDKVFIGK